MAKITISDLAKEIRVPDRAIGEYLTSKDGKRRGSVTVLEENEIALVKRHFEKLAANKKAKMAQEQPLRRPEGAAPQRKMLDGPEAKTASTGRRMAEGPTDKKPARRMLEGPQDRNAKPMQTAQKARTNDGIRTAKPQNAANKNAPRTINGVTISSDDGDRRLIHGSYKSEAEMDALRKDKAEAAKARREQEKVEEAKKLAEREAEQELLAAQVRKEAESIEKNIAEQKARAEQAKAKAEAEEAAKAAKAAEEAAAKEAAAKEAVKEEKEAPAQTDSFETDNTETVEAPAPVVEEKKFKTIDQPVRPNVLRRAPVGNTGRPEIKEKSEGANRPQNGEKRFDRNNNGDRNNGERRNFGDRNGQRPQGDRGPRPQGDRNGRPQADRGPRPQGDRNHFQAVESRYNGDNKGHSNLFEKQSDRRFGGNDQGNQGNRDNRGRNSGFSTRPQSNGFGGKDDEDNQKPVSHSRDPKKRTGSAAPELAESMKSANNRRNDKSKDKEKANKRYNDYDEEQGGKKGKGGKDPNRAGAFHRPEPVKAAVVEETIKTITLPDVLTIQELADKMKLKSSDIVKKLFLAGKMVTMNSEISFEEAEEIALEYEIICEHEEKVDKVAELLKEADEEEEKLVKRPPVVCVMGHVDHGKTSLLDAIRTTSVTSREAGGITQHIGAYMVEAGGEKITFLDTPGHEAFTAMRMRGANATDIAVLVVAADDGVMPQTIEAINHAKAAGVEIIVAVNKIDKPTANLDRVKQELTEYNLISEDWGGSTVFVPVSAKTHENIDKLLEMILLTADVLELKANPDRKARGLVVEAQLDKGRGPVATVLVQKGTLKVGDNVVIGSSMGKVRALINDKGEKVKVATPSMPVEILGLNSVPNSGEIVVATASEKEAKEIAEAYIEQNKEKLIAETKSKMSLDGLFSQIKAGSIKELNIVVKADVQGSVEAIKQSLVKLSNEEVAVRIIHSGVGAVNESDATLASASNAIIIAFNVKPDNTAKDICEHENVDLRLYNVIYNAIDDVEAAMKGMLDPIFEEKIIAHAEVRQTFKASGVGTIAGSYVLDGKITRGCKARITRGKNQIFDGNLASLKRFKDDVKEVNAGYECGLVFEGFQDLLEGDLIELYAMVEVPRK